MDEYPLPAGHHRRRQPAGSPPLGQYDPTRLLNVGTNRWSIRPELGVSKAWGPVILELIPAVSFFTNNNDFFGDRPSRRTPCTPCRDT